MKHLERQFFLFCLYILAAPIYLISGLWKLPKQVRRLSLAVQAKVKCQICSEDVPLVGMWRCPCGFQYQGHLIQTCPNCGRTPSMARCWNCGATVMLS